MAKEAVFLLLPIALAMVALGSAESAGRSQTSRRLNLMTAAARGMALMWRRYRGVCMAALLLLAAGIAIYLPVRLNNPGGRYSIPAAWGGDLLFAALLSLLLGAPAGVWKQAAYGAVAAGVGCIAIVNLASQAAFEARAACLWQTLELVERNVPPGVCVGWLYGPELARGEGIHFAWHAHARRHPFKLALIDAASGQQESDDVGNLGGAICHHPDLLISGVASVPPRFDFALTRTVEVPYRLGTRRFRCYVWQRPRTAGGR